MKITFSIKTKELLNATKEIRRFIRGKKNKQKFNLKIKVSKTRLILYGIGVEQIVKISESKGVGFIYIPIELFYMILGSIKEKELTLVFTPGEIAYSNAKSGNSKIILSKIDISNTSSTTIIPRKNKEYSEEKKQEISSKKQSKIFIDRDILNHKSNDKNYVNSLIKKEYHNLLLLAINKLPISEKQNINSTTEDDVLAQNIELSIGHSDIGEIRFVNGGKCELYFSEPLKTLDLIYSDKFEYQLFFKEDIEQLNAKMARCKAFLTKLTGVENFSYKLT